MANTTTSIGTTTLVPIPHPHNEELAAVGDISVIVIQAIALLFEFCIAIPMVITLCKSYNKIYAKPKPEDELDDNSENIENIKLLHHGRISTFISILTYISAGFFIIIQEIHEAPWIVDHLVYIFLILSYTFIFIALRNIGMEYFLTFVLKYCDEHSINNQKRNEFERLFKGIYNAFGAFSIIYWFGYLLAVGTNKNNFIVTAIGLGHIYLATISLLHGGMLKAMHDYKDNDTQSSRLLDDNDTNNKTDDNTTNIMMQTIDLDEKKDDNEDNEDNDENEDIAGDEKQNSNDNINQNDDDDDKPLPLIKKWIYFFCGCGVLLILEGISYAVAYSKNTGDFEFPEVHPFFLFTIFAFFAILHYIFCKYTWIEY